MRIGELSKRTGVKVRLLRYYEEKGLLVSARSDSGQRRYTEAAVDRVAFVRRLLVAGVPSHAIAEMLPCAEAPSQETIDQAMGRLARERDRITGHIDDLVRARIAIDGLMETARENRERLSASPED
ncbi:MerR family transcriptional regulator [Actinorugispora endophytica]|uniref:DNA-binding transcriptional MerR regulator n=1 Tax=Actinorugispora endophytica TaxID=1605990 RepID=A0A4R6V476_9ACTN|nr:MerR family transcriptional regulator [Actinorugispora endophytica]TDQ54983.1 DNA-binding transcriptional MerR regulator [Actinorugispora endophytica]